MLGPVDPDHLRLSEGVGVRASGTLGETVTRREVSGRGNSSLNLMQSRRFVLDRENGTEKALGVFVAGIDEQITRGRLLDDLTGVHHRDLVSE